MFPGRGKSDHIGINPDVTVCINIAKKRLGAERTTSKERQWFYFTTATSARERATNTSLSVCPVVSPSVIFITPGGLALETRHLWGRGESREVEAREEQTRAIRC